MFDIDHFRKQWHHKDFWNLRALIINHYLYWQDERKTEANFKPLLNYLLAHSDVKSMAELKTELRTYHREGIFTDPDKLSPETGLLNPDNVEMIHQEIFSDFDLTRPLLNGFTVATFLWSAYHDWGEKHKLHEGASLMADQFCYLFNEIVKLDVRPLEVGIDHTAQKYLKMTWQQSNGDTFAWYMGFLAGKHLKGDGLVAKALTKDVADNIEDLSNEESACTEEFWTLCALDIGPVAIDKTRMLETRIQRRDRRTHFNLVTALSMIKFFTWANQKLSDKSKPWTPTRLHDGLRYMLVDQDVPMSISQGIEAVDPKKK